MMDDESIIMIIDAIILLLLFPLCMMPYRQNYVSFFHINTFIIFMGGFIVIFLLIVLVLHGYFGG